MTPSDDRTGDEGGSDGPPPNVDMLLHDVNNHVGRLIASLHLGLADLEADHPIRSRFESANTTALELRKMTMELAEIFRRQ